MHAPPTTISRTIGLRSAVLAVVECPLARIGFGMERGVAVLRGEHDWEPDEIYYSIDELRQHVYGLVHDIRASLVGFVDDASAEDPEVAALVDAALAAHHEQIEVLGWSAHHAGRARL